jgi:hypothetical protein
MTDTTPAPAPQPLMSRFDRDRQVGPDGTSFPWGPIDQVHQVGPYQIVEFREDRSTMAGPNAHEDHGRTMYASFVDGRRTAHSHYTLDEALAFAIAYRHEGINTRAGDYFIRMIGADTEQN